MVFAIDDDKAMFLRSDLRESILASLLDVMLHDGREASPGSSRAHHTRSSDSDSTLHITFDLSVGAEDAPRSIDYAARSSKRHAALGHRARGATTTRQNRVPITGARQIKPNDRKAKAPRTTPAKNPIMTRAVSTSLCFTFPISG